MKVLFTFGGLPHYFNLILNKLNAVPGIEVVVVVPKESEKTLGKGVFQKREGIEFKVIELTEYTTFYGKPFFKGFKDVLNEEKPDVIVIIWPYILQLVTNPGLINLIRKLGIKLIYKDIPFNIPKLTEAEEYYREKKFIVENKKPGKSTSAEMLKYRLLTWARKKYFRIMDAHVYYTQEAYEIIPSYGVPKEKIFLTYNSPDTEALLKVEEKIKHLPPILPPNEYRILHVGRLVDWKRVDLLIEVTSRLKKSYPTTELIVIGSGPEEEKLKLLAKTLNIEDSVKFIGGVYDPEVLGQYFVSSSIYVLAGMGGLSINEAMFYGRPILCSVADGTEKVLVREGINGRYFENGSAEDLYNKLNEMLSNQEQLKKFGLVSKQIIKDEINLHTVLKGYINAFNYVLAGKNQIHYPIKNSQE